MIYNSTMGTYAYFELSALAAGGHMKTNHRPNASTFPQLHYIHYLKIQLRPLPVENTFRLLLILITIQKSIAGSRPPGCGQASQKHSLPGTAGTRHPPFTHPYHPSTNGRHESQRLFRNPRSSSSGILLFFFPFVLTYLESEFYFLQ